MSLTDIYFECDLGVVLLYELITEESNDLID